MGKPTVGSLFAGIGGLDLGLERAGFECKWQVEIDPYARQVLDKHWPDVPKFEDVREFPPIGDFKVDLICGGFPCQDISYAGKGAGLDGERSGLFYELIRVVSLVGPRFILLENVSALLTRGLDQVLGTLASIGYDAEWHCISAAHVGAPHIRDRIFIIAYSNSTKQHRAYDDSTPHECGRMGQTVSNTVRSEIEPRSGRRGIRKSNKTLADSASDGCRQVEQQVRGGEKSVGESCATRELSEFRRRVEMWWAVEPAVGRVANGIPSRVDRLRGLGNAVVPQVAEYIGRQIIKQF